MWCIPPKANARFVAEMENILDVYQLPPDPLRPLVCVDEFCKQLLSEVTEPLEMEPGKIKKVDSEYCREGSATGFMIYAPLEGKREVVITENATRTKIDYANVMKFVSDEMFPEAEKIIIVEDNLNTHNDGSFYEAFEPQEARRLAKRFERHHTPKHGSWLNIAESEISALTRSSISDRVESREEFEAQCKSGVKIRNEKNAKTNWQFTAEDSRVKLKSLYPTFEN